MNHDPSTSRDGGAKRLECGDLSPLCKARPGSKPAALSVPSEIGDKSPHTGHCREVEDPGSRAQAAIWDRHILSSIPLCFSGGPVQVFPRCGTVSAPDWHFSAVREILTRCPR